jgi:hypothetical protein
MEILWDDFLCLLEQLDVIKAELQETSGMTTSIVESERAISEAEAVTKLTELVHNSPGIPVTCSPANCDISGFLFHPSRVFCDAFWDAGESELSLIFEVFIQFLILPQELEQKVPMSIWIATATCVVLGSYLLRWFVRGRWINRQRGYLMTTARSRAGVPEVSPVPSLALLKFLSLECWKHMYDPHGVCCGVRNNYASAAQVLH